MIVEAKKITIQDKKLKQFFRKGGRKGAKKDFFELVRRSAVSRVKR